MVERAHKHNRAAQQGGEGARGCASCLGHAPRPRRQLGHGLILGSARIAGRAIARRYCIRPTITYVPPLIRAASSRSRQPDAAEPKAACSRSSSVCCVCCCAVPGWMGLDYWLVCARALPRPLVLVALTHGCSAGRHCRWTIPPALALWLVFRKLRTWRDVYKTLFLITVRRCPWSGPTSVPSTDPPRSAPRSPSRQRYPGTRISSATAYVRHTAP